MRGEVHGAKSSLQRRASGRHGFQLRLIHRSRCERRVERPLDGDDVTPELDCPLTHRVEDGLHTALLLGAEAE